MRFQELLKNKIWDLMYRPKVDIKRGFWLKIGETHREISVTGKSQANFLFNPIPHHFFYFWLKHGNSHHFFILHQNNISSHFCMEKKQS